MVSTSEFFDKLRALKPQDELRPGVVFVGILHYDKSHEKTFDQPDAIWIKCPKEKDVSSLVRAYKKACPEAGQFVLRHNFQILEEGIKISALANRYPNDFVALDVTNGVNRPITKVQASGKSNDEPNIRQFQLGAAPNSRLDGTPPVPNPQTTHPPPGIQAVPGPNHLNLSKQTGWEDFLFERLEFTRQSVTFSSNAPQRYHDLSTFDQATKQEWLNFDDAQKSYFMDRGTKITSSSRLTVLENRYAEHWAFWCFYYDAYFRRPAGTAHLEHDFEARKAHIEESLATWKAMNLNTRKLWFDHAWMYSTAALKRGALTDPVSASPAPATPSGAGDSEMKTESTPLRTPSPQEDQIPEFEGPVIEANFHVDLEDAPGASNAAPVRLSMSELLDGRTPEQLEKSVEKGVDLLGQIQRTLQAQPSQEATQWIEAIEKVQKQATRSKTVVGIVGATGAGKSSVINAMLDEERLVPTNCMRACTAVVTEISYNHEEGNPYRAEVEFIARDDWHKMLKVLFQDLIDGSGQVSRECNNDDSVAGIAYAQIKAVYPKMTKEEMPKITIERLMQHENVACLGSTRDIESDDSLIFYRKLQRYVDSKEKTSSAKDKSDKKDKVPKEMEYWPLIKVVRLYTKAPALVTGAVIVHLPGVHDSNQARAAVATGYLKQCTGLWIVAPINRAVDDKSAKTLLGDTFKRQLKMDGGFNSVTFICSKTDDISITEAQDSLGLDKELTPMWEKSEELRKRKKALIRQIDELKETKFSMNAVMEILDDETEVWDKILEDFNSGVPVFEPKPKSQKRKREDDKGLSKKRPNYAEPDSDDDFIDDGSDSDNDAKSDYASPTDSDFQRVPLTEDEITMKSADIRGRRKEGRRAKATIDDEIKALRSEISDLEKESDSIDGKLSSACISGRNEYSRGAIRQDYAAGIRELDQEIAEEEDAANFDPETDRRDYDEVAQNLPVFCVSSRAYQKLKGRLQKDKSPPGFTHIDQTEVPALQAHCVELTTVGRQASCRKFLTSMFQLLNSLRLWSSNDGSGRNLTEGQLKREAQILKERMSKLDSKAVTVIINGISEELQDKVYDAYPAATGAAKSEAVNTVRKWGSPADRENFAAGGLYWATYKAVVRRDGAFTNARASNNFNEQLIEPVMRHLAGPWESIFARRAPGILNSLPANVGQVLTTFHDEVERRALRNGVSLASFHMLKHQIPVYKESLKDAMSDARSLITEKQRNINREFEPRIVQHMLPIYHTCTAETGPGQFVRLKGYMDRHVEHEQSTMFDDAVEHVRGLIKTMLKEVKDILLNKVDAVFMAIERDYTTVIIGQEQGKSKEVLPRDQRLMRKAVLEFIDHSETAFKQAVGLEPEPAAEPDLEPEVQHNVSEVQFQPAEADVAVKEETSGGELPDQRKLDTVQVRTATPQQQENVNDDRPASTGLLASASAEPSHIKNDRPATAELPTPGSVKASHLSEDVTMQDAAPVTTANEQGVKEELKDELRPGTADTMSI